VDGQAPDQRPPVGGVPRGDVGTVHGDEARRRVVVSVQSTATKHAAAW